MNTKQTRNYVFYVTVYDKVNDQNRILAVNGRTHFPRKDTAARHAEKFILDYPDHTYEIQRAYLWDF